MAWTRVVAEGWQQVIIIIVIIIDIYQDFTVCCSKSFTFHNSFYPHTILMKWVLISLLYLRGVQGSERSSNLCKVPQLISGRTQVLCSWSLPSSPLMLSRFAAKQMLLSSPLCISSLLPLSYPGKHCILPLPL